MSNVRPISQVKDRKHPEVTKLTYATGRTVYRVRLLGADKRCDSYAEAVALVAQVRSDHAQGIKHTRPATVTVNEVADQVVAAWLYESQSLNGIRLSTLTDYEDKLKYLRKECGDDPLAKLTVERLQALIVKGRTQGIARADGKAPRPWGNDTHRKFLVVMNKLFDYAVAHRLAQVNVARQLAAPSQKGKAAAPAADKFLSAPEMNDVQSILAHHPLGIAFRLGLAGFRRGEVAGLRWADIDFDDELIVIANSRVELYRDGHTMIEEGLPKGGKARDYPLVDPDLVAALRAARRAQREQALALGPAYVRSGYVVVLPTGEPYTPGTISKAWKKFLAGEELRHVKFHGTRHSFATNAANTPGVGIHNVKDMLGHADIKTTGIYLHADRESLRRAARAASETVAAAVPRPGSREQRGG